MLNHQNKTQPKEPLQLLSYNQYVTTRVGIISLVGFSMAATFSVITISKLWSN